MKAHKSLICVVIAMLLLLGIVSFPSDTRGTELLGGEITMDIPEDNSELLFYASAPEGLRVFIYLENMYLPHESLVNENWIVGGLYSMVRETGALVRIGNDLVSTAAPTKDHIYYITTDGIVARSNYQGNEITELARLEGGSSKELLYFDGALFFIVNDSKIMKYTITSQSMQTIMEALDIHSIYVFDHDKILWRNSDQYPNYYNCSTGNNVVLNSEFEANVLISPYLVSTSNGNVSVMSAITDENDVALPLTEYPATVRDIYNWNYPAGGSYFRIGDKTVPGCYHPYNKEPEEYEETPKSDCRKYTSAGQCDGFAMYAHDCYYHIVDTARTKGQWWALPDYDASDRDFSKGFDIEGFFENMQRGTFVRYGKDRYANGAFGAHSMVFDHVDANGQGIWVHECNQDERCGVHYQYWPYSQIRTSYDYIAHIMSHPMTSNCIMYSVTKHKLMCNTSGCGAYVLRNHTGNQIMRKNDSLTHTVFNACCSGSIARPHTFNSIDVCIGCGFVSDEITLNRKSLGRELQICAESAS